MIGQINLNDEAGLHIKKICERSDVNNIVEIDKLISEKREMLDEVSSIDEETQSINGSIDTLQSEIENYDKEINILLEKQKTTTSVCPTCDGDGFVTTYKVEANVE